MLARREGGAETAGTSPALTWLLSAFAFSLAFMQPHLFLFGFAAVASDFLFALLLACFAAALVAGRARLAWDRAYGLMAIYFAALFASFVVSSDPESTPAKLATQLYLLAIPVLTLSLVRSERDLRLVVQAWLAGTSVVALTAVASLLLFAADPQHPLLELTRFQFGTLPPGPYPRLQLTFVNANMACNYLVVSLALLLAAGRLHWVNGSVALLLGIGIAVAALTTISPGFGGILLLAGLWLWMLWRDNRPRPARLVLGAGICLALLFLAATAVTPILHPTAPFLIPVPLTGLTLAPSPRLMIWIEAASNFLEHPFLGRGIGADAVLVRYLDPSGRLQQLTDAHNMFLNIAVQSGLVGLAALVALVVHMARRTGPLRLPERGSGVLRVAAGLGLLNGLVYQGLGGSFEDSRHLWFAFGLLLASARLESGKARPTAGS